MGTGKLLIGLGVIFYTLFFLLPDSSTQIVAFPWVLFLGTGLLCFNLASLVNLWRNYLGHKLGGKLANSSNKLAHSSQPSLSQKSEIFALGYGLDVAVIITVVTVVLASIRAQFSSPSWWYSLGVIGSLGAIYALRQNLANQLDQVDHHSQNYHSNHNYHSLWKLLEFQGGLSLIFTIESLGLWLWQTFLPRWQYIQQLHQWGLFLNYDFNELESRNWAPLGHQNYVAGVLILSLPIWISLGLRHYQRSAQESSPQGNSQLSSIQVSLFKRIPWLWLGAMILGFIDLYTTSSRGGFLGLGILIVYGLMIAIIRKMLPRKWLWGSTAALAAIVIIMVQSNNRLRTLLTQILAQWQNSGNSNLNPSGAVASGGETLFRTITTEIGWRIGLDHWLTGAGLGNVPLLYQKYRPQWADREAEWLFQLHNTPAQLWAELGVMGVITVTAWVLALIWLFWRLHRSSYWWERPLLQIPTYGILGSFLAYGVVAITDFQLDVPAISGFLVILIAGISYIGCAVIPQPITTHDNHDMADLSLINNNPKPTFWAGQLGQTLPLIPLQSQRFLSVIGLGSLVAILIWSAPILLAWQSSSVGFMLLRNARITLTEYTNKLDAQSNQGVNPNNNSGNKSDKLSLDFAANSGLNQNSKNTGKANNHEATELLNIALGEIDGFRQKLVNAHQLAPWQTYYPYQLGWNLAELSISYPNLPQVQEWQTEGLKWLQEAARLSPYTESAYNSIGWLSLNQRQPQAAADAFRNGLNLISSKRSLQLGLGISLWQQGKKDQAVAAFAQEILNEPSFITSPIWETPQMMEAYPLLCEFLNRPEMQKAVAAKFSPEFAARFLALVHWWQGKPINDVINELAALKQSATDLLVQVLRNDRQALAALIEQPRTPTQMLIAAWYRPQERSQLIEKAYVHATRNLPTANLPLITAIAERMQSVAANGTDAAMTSKANDTNINLGFDQWLRGKLERQSPLILKYRRTRLGFGVVSRQIDGPIPSDFFQTEDRALISLFFSDLFSLN